MPGIFDGKDPTSHEVLSDMLDDAIGLDNPMTPEAVNAGLDEVQERVDNAQSWLSWKPGDPPPDLDTYDTQALAALVLAYEELEAEE